MPSPQAVVFIDADSISPKLHHQVIAHVKKKVEDIEIRICGTESGLKGWQKRVKSIPYVPILVPTEPNAADKRISQEALTISIDHPQIKIFFIVSNDGDFAPLCLLLAGWGYRAIPVGFSHAASELKKIQGFISLVG